MPPTSSSLQVRAASQLAPRQIDWLWPGRLALGKLVLLDGDPGLGKSLIALDLCARLSRGLPFPNGAGGGAPTNSLILNGEDDEEDTVIPRLAALGADLDRVFVARQGLDAYGAVSFPSHIRQLDEALADTRARLLVIDPIMAFLDPGILSGSDQSIRRALYPLACLAVKHCCVAKMIRHLNKSPSGHALYRGAGSIAFVAACRSAWLVARDPHDPGRCVLAENKNNLAPPQPSLSYAVTGTEGATPTLSWLGACPWTANELVATVKSATKGSPREQACDFLLDFLSKGPRTSREVWTASQEHRLAKRTLDRAKEDLDIRSVWVAGDGSPLSYWLLPHQQAPVDEESDIEPWLAPLRKRFPPPTPLDDL
jgi:hypothetical protein